MPRIRIDPDRPTPRDIWRYWLATKAALDAQFDGQISGPRALRGPYVGLPRAEAAELLEDLRSELDGQVVLALIASFEAHLRVDFMRRYGQGTRDKVVRSFLSAHSTAAALDPRTRIRFILDAWKGSHRDKAALRTLDRLFDYRNWLAHGRWWQVADHFSPQATSDIATTASKDPLFPSLRV